MAFIYSFNYSNCYGVQNVRVCSKGEFVFKYNINPKCLGLFQRLVRFNKKRSFKELEANYSFNPENKNINLISIQFQDSIEITKE